VISGQAYDRDWSLPLSAKSNAGLAFDGRNLYVDDFAGDVMAVDPGSGTVKWRAHLDNLIMSTPIVHDGLVFVGTGSNRIMWDTPNETLWGRPQGDHIFALSTSTGNVMWSHPSRGEAMPSPAYSDGRLIFANGNSQAIAVDPKSGADFWTTLLPGIDTMASVMVDGGAAFVVVSRGPASSNPIRSHVVALSLKDGSLLWQAPYGNADCSPTVHDDTLFVEGSTDIQGSPALGANVVDAIDIHSGALRWEYRTATGYFTNVASSERAIAATYSDGVLYQSLPSVDQFAAFDASSGKLLWSVSTSAPVKMSGVVSRGQIFFGDTAGLFYALDAKTGDVRKVLAYPKPFTTAPFLIVGKMLFFIDTDVLYATKLDEVSADHL
jgi:outer membrane protein assembly factor BamB